MLKSISNILKQCAEQKTTADVVTALRENNHPIVRQILFYAFAPQVKFVLPEGAPPYTPCEFLDQEGRLYTEMRKMYLFIEGGNPNLTRVKRETLFIQLLESISKEDAVLLIHVKDKKLPFKKITEKVVREAFPDLLPQEES
jgi:hypothetical protein